MPLLGLERALCFEKLLNSLLDSFVCYCYCNECSFSWVLSYSFEDTYSSFYHYVHFPGLSRPSKLPVYKQSDT